MGAPCCDYERRDAYCRSSQRRSTMRIYLGKVQGAMTMATPAPRRSNSRVHKRTCHRAERSQALVVLQTPREPIARVVRLHVAPAGSTDPGSDIRRCKASGESRDDTTVDPLPLALPLKAHLSQIERSTNTSITRTALLPSMKPSKHSGNDVRCPRSACSTKRLISSPRRITRES